MNMSNNYLTLRILFIHSLYTSCLPTRNLKHKLFRDRYFSILSTAVFQASKTKPAIYLVLN